MHVPSKALNTLFLKKESLAGRPSACRRVPEREGVFPSARRSRRRHRRRREWRAILRLIGKQMTNEGQHGRSGRRLATIVSALRRGEAPFVALTKPGTMSPEAGGSSGQNEPPGRAPQGCLLHAGR